MEIKFVFNRLPKNSIFELDIDWENDNNDLAQGWNPSLRKDFKEVKNYVEARILEFFVENSILPFDGLCFCGTYKHTFWQFKVGFVWIEPKVWEEKISKVIIQPQISIICADIAEGYEKEIIPKKYL